ncbi:hypothetical protein DIPPA_03392 [Diplonema papillatum]|nr:hypothetical protein DIPPA_03392 [Diplonema papillatum]
MVRCRCCGNRVDACCEPETSAGEDACPRCAWEDKRLWEEYAGLTLSRSTEEDNVLRIAELREKLGMPRQTGTRGAGLSLSQLEKASPENAARIRSIREHLGVPLLSLRGSSPAHQSKPHPLAYSSFLTHGPRSSTSPPAFAPLASLPAASPRSYLTPPSGAPAQQRATNYSSTGPTNYPGAFTPGSLPRTEWEKWDAKAVHQPFLATPEQLGEDTARQAMANGYYRAS